MTVNNEDIMLMLGEIRGDIKAIHVIMNLKTYQDTQSGQTKLISVAWASVSSLIVASVSYFLFNK
jgi:hypothetical protein